MLTLHDKNNFLASLNYLIERNATSETIQVDFVAQNLCMSISTLYRRMIETTGMGLNQYVRNKKLEMAVKLLTNASGGGQALSIGDAAFACGFASPSVFSKSFRKRYGMSLTRYLDLLQESAENASPSGNESGNPQPKNSKHKCKPS